MLGGKRTLAVLRRMVLVLVPLAADGTGELLLGWVVTADRSPIAKGARVELRPRMGGSLPGRDKAGRLESLVVVSELWNHYAAAVYKAKLPIGLIPAQRNCRLEGSSRMNLVALVVHGLSAMAVFGDRIGVRLLILVSFGMSLVGLALIGVIGIRFLTPLAIPGWATYVVGILLVILMQMLPFYDDAALRVLNGFEQRVYTHLK